MSEVADWYIELRDLGPSNRRAFLALLATLPHFPTSYLDIGCGAATTVALMAKLLDLNEVMGIDLYPTSILVHKMDLNEPVDLGRYFDLVTCWEVGEHLYPHSADIFCETVVRHVGDVLVFTAARPEQGGHRHINCQPPEYWQEKLVALGLEYDEDLTNRLKNVWGYTAGACIWLTQNAQVFRKPKQECAN